MENKINKIKIYMIGSYAGLIREFLRERNIVIENLIDGGCPFALVGEKEPKMEHYVNECDDLATVSYIKKNFSNMLSRNKEEYDSNFKKIPLWKSVDYCNTTSYLVIYFTNITELWKMGKGIYASVYPSNRYDKDIKMGELISAPFPKFFNWKYYIKEFADVCIQNYDSEHIILIKSNITDYYMENGNIKRRSKSLAPIRIQVKMIEDYFVNLTNCKCVNDFVNYITEGEQAPFRMPPFAFEQVADSIYRITVGK